jgi:hypothetical protein
VRAEQNLDADFVTSRVLDRGPVAIGSGRRCKQETRASGLRRKPGRFNAARIVAAKLRKAAISIVDNGGDDGQRHDPRDVGERPPGPYRRYNLRIAGRLLGIDQEFAVGATRNDAKSEFDGGERVERSHR